MDNTPYRRESAEKTTEAQPVQPEREKQPFTQSSLFWVLIGVGIVIIVLGVWMLIKSSSDSRRQAEEAMKAKEEAELALEQQALQFEYESLNREFDEFESQRLQITNDSLKLALEEKYNTARMEVERLQRELKDTKNKSAAEIAKLKNEIDTLRALLKHYVEEIDRLNKENQALREENAQIKDQNQQLQSQVSSTAERNRQLSQDMERASKLNVNGVGLQPLNKKGKTEKNVKKARQFAVNFTVLKNVSASVGEKTFYVRITTPSADLLGGGGSFSFEGSQVPYTAKRTIEYGGDDVPVTIYYDCANNTLSGGAYTVEVFTDGYRVG
ncbi:MAG: hypothetical protein K2L80_04140, partial [Muribaculaceae bacterium]|nr:hypothetical protein [Muribaculaceae bacterium]